MRTNIMKSLVYIDACMRGKESRTRRIAEPIIDKLSERYEIIKSANLQSCG